MVQQPLVRQINGDRDALDLWPVLGERCRRDDMFRMWRYSRARYGIDHIDTDGLEGAATRVLEEVQKVLREREGCIDHFAAYELYWEQRWSLDALLHLHGHKFAKETQVRLAGGRPLTICVGTGGPRHVTTVLGTYRYSGCGCYRVFEDPLLPRGRMFAHWCHDCRRRKTSAFRSEERALRRHHAEIAAAISRAANTHEVS
jgi:hypothetical protein